MEPHEDNALTLAEAREVNFEFGLDVTAARELQAELDDRQNTVEALSADNEALKAKLVDAEKAVKSAKASVTRAATPAAPRKLKTMDDGLSGDDLTEALTKADAGGKTVEIAFSDGKREIEGIPPIVITGEVWRDHTRGKMLRDPVKVDGPTTGGSSVAIDGYALMIDGKQVAYCQRSEPVRVNAGQTISLQDDIWF